MASGWAKTKADTEALGLRRSRFRVSCKAICVATGAHRSTMWQCMNNDYTLYILYINTHISHKHRANLVMANKCVNIDYFSFALASHHQVLHCVYHFTGFAQHHHVGLGQFQLVVSKPGQDFPPSLPVDRLWWWLISLQKCYNPTTREDSWSIWPGAQLWDVDSWLAMGSATSL